MPVRNILVTAAAAMAVSGLAADARPGRHQRRPERQLVRPRHLGQWRAQQHGARRALGQPTNANINGNHTVTIDQAGETTLRLDLGTGLNSGNVGHLVMTGGDLTVSNPDNPAGGALTSIRVAQEVGTSGSFTMSGGTINIAGPVGSPFAEGELIVGDNGAATMTMTGGTITAADEVFFGLGARAPPPPTSAAAPSPPPAATC